MDHEQHERAMIQFKSPQGETVGPVLDIPLNIGRAGLEKFFVGIIEADDELAQHFELPTNIRKNVELFSFLLQGKANVGESLKDSLASLEDKQTTESLLEITYHPISMFSVRPVGRCSASMPGHSEGVLCCQFSPDGQTLATGSGDTSVRFWDVTMETLNFTGRLHQDWVLVVKFSPCGKFCASACQSGRLVIWEMAKRKEYAQVTLHNVAVMSLCWKPEHLGGGLQLISAGKDRTARLLDVQKSPRVVHTFSGHSDVITSVLWSGSNLIFTCGRDRLIKAWHGTHFNCVANLSGHAHWINNLCLNTEFVLRTGAFDHTPANKNLSAADRYAKHMQVVGSERLLSCSDDFTLFLWDVVTQKTIKRLTGHQKAVTCMQFSPDGQYIASGSFDKSIRVWDGRTGNALKVLRGHVGDVYSLAWAPDSQIFLSGSKDSTLKVWNVNKLVKDLPGHADAVYCVDWSPDAQKCSSGSKDRKGFMSGSVNFTLKVGHYIDNPLLERKQFMLQVTHQLSRKPTKAEMVEKLCKMFDVKNPLCISLFSMKSQFGGRTSTVLCLVYNSLDAARRTEPAHRLKRQGLTQLKGTKEVHRVRANRRAKKTLKVKIRMQRARHRVGEKDSAPKKRDGRAKIIGKLRGIKR